MADERAASEEAKDLRIHCRVHFYMEAEVTENNESRVERKTEQGAKFLAERRKEYGRSEDNYRE